jgi:uncharacterized protein (DUF2384 family)
MLDPKQRLEHEGSLIDEVKTIFSNAEGWLNQPHPMLGGRKPQECVDDGEEQLVWDLLRGIKFVGQT